MTADPASLAREWARQLPRDFAHRLADALLRGPDAVRALGSAAALSSSAAAVCQALKLAAENGDGAFTSGCLSAFLEVVTEQPDVTTVWTGPDSRQPGGRLTLAVLADLNGEAREHLLLVSYATFPGPEVRRALGSTEQEQGRAGVGRDMRRAHCCDRRNRSRRRRRARHG